MGSHNGVTYSSGLTDKYVVRYMHSNPLAPKHRIDWWLFSKDKGTYGSREEDGRYFAFPLDFPLPRLTFLSTPHLTCVCQIGTPRYLFSLFCRQCICGMFAKFYGVSGLKGGMVCATLPSQALTDELIVISPTIELSSCQDVYWCAD